MSALDTAIVGAYLIALLMAGAWLGRANRTADDHFVGGRRMPWWALAVSTMATQSSANSFIGIPAFVALVPGGGLSWLQYEIAVPLATLLVMIVFLPVFRALRLVSIYEYLEMRFDRPTRLLLSGVFLASRALTTGVALYAAALVIEICAGLPLRWSVALMGAVTVVYDLMGGMHAVVWTDVLQSVVLLLGLGVCAAYAWSLLGSWEVVLSHVPPQRLATIEWAHGLGDGARAPFWGFVVGGTVLYAAYYGVDQSQVQRQLSASSVDDVRRLLIFNAFGRFPLTLCYALLGLLLAAVYASDATFRAAIPDGRPDILVPRFIERMLPEGARGILVAAVLAAAMSSLDSALNSLSAATMRDFMGSDSDSPSGALKRARLTTVAWGALITVIGLLADRFGGSVIEGINRVGSLFYGPLLAAFACGILDPRATGAAVRSGVAAGLGANLVLLATLDSSIFWMWWNVSGLLIAAAVCFALSRALPQTKTRSPRPGSMTGDQLAAHVRSLHGWTTWLLTYTLAMSLGLYAIWRFLSGSHPGGA